MNSNKPLDEWESLIEKIGPAHDDYERLIRHFYGFNIFYGFKYGFIKKTIASILTPISLKKLKNSNVFLIEKVDCVITASDKAYVLNDENLPIELRENYPIKKRIYHEGNSLLNQWNEYCLDEAAIEIIKEARKRFPKEKIMILSLILHLGRACEIVHKYNPKAIIVTQAEQDYTSTMITRYCESKGIDYICVQHGEYCYNPSMAFMRFTRYYAWNKETIEILELTNNKIDFATIYSPAKLSVKYIKKDNPEHFITYYLSDEKSKDLDAIRDLLEKFINNEFDCCVRWHPRSYKEDVIIKHFGKSKVKIENPFEVSINDSITNTEYIVGYRTTILSEATLSGLNTVIDDVTQDINYLIRVKDQNVNRIKLRLSELIHKYELDK